MLEKINIKRKMKKNLEQILRIIIAIILVVTMSINTVFADDEEDGNTTGTAEQQQETTENTSETPTDTPTTTEDIDTTTQTTEKSNQEEQTTKEEPETTVQEVEQPPVVEEPEVESETKQEPEQVSRQTETVYVSPSNANLSNLGITPNDFSGFRENITSYSVSVPNSVKEVNVYASAKDSRASVTGTGKIQLKEGNNTASVIVTAQDGTTKTYTINIKRLKEGETEETVINTSVWLEKIEVEGFNLEPSFNKDIHQYTIKVEGGLEKLDIKTQANKEDAQIKILGNNKLINGQNIVTILVSNEEEGIVTYQLYVNKNLVDQAELNRHIEEAETKYKIKQGILIGLVVLIVINIIILLVLIYKKKKNPEFKSEKIGKNSDENVKVSIDEIQNVIKENSLQNNNEEVEETKEDSQIIEEPKKEKRRKSGKHSK